MRMEIDSDGLEVLDADECRKLLANGRVGRIALTNRALPLIVPVKFAVLGDDIVLRAATERMEQSALHGHVVCLQSDGVYASGSDGWSVIVTGPLGVVDDPIQIEMARHLELERWSKRHHGVLAYLHTEMISGRRFALSDQR